MLFQIPGANLKLSCFSFYLFLPHSSPSTLLLYHLPPQYILFALRIPAIPIFSFPKVKNALQNSAEEMQKRKHSYSLKIIPSQHPAYLQLIWAVWHLQLTALLPTALLSSETIPGIIFTFHSFSLKIAALFSLPFPHSRDGDFIGAWTFLLISSTLTKLLTSTLIFTILTSFLSPPSS